MKDQCTIGGYPKGWQEPNESSCLKIDEPINISNWDLLEMLKKNAEDSKLIVGRNYKRVITIDTAKEGDDYSFNLSEDLT